MIVLTCQENHRVLLETNTVDNFDGYREI